MQFILPLNTFKESEKIFYDSLKIFDILLIVPVWLLRPNYGQFSWPPNEVFAKEKSFVCLNSNKYFSKKNYYYLMSCKLQLFISTCGWLVAPIDD